MWWKARKKLSLYSLGYLYGAWPDGRPFDHNRYVDRFRGAGMA